MGEALFLEIFEIFNGLIRKRFCHASDYNGENRRDNSNLRRLDSGPRPDSLLSLADGGG